jgi:hypothetical protein
LFASIVLLMATARKKEKKAKNVALKVEVHPNRKETQ